MHSMNALEILPQCQKRRFISPPQTDKKEKVTVFIHITDNTMSVIIRFHLNKAM